MRHVGVALRDLGLGRIRYGPSKELLSEYLRSGEEPVRFAAAIALARIGVRSVEFCLDEARCKTWPLLPLALMGGPGTYPVLRRAAATSGGDGLLAIGLHGDAEGIPFLIHCLDQQKDAPSAAVALDCITGSGLCETVFMPDELQEDELLDSEREDFRNKGTPTRGDGKPLGSAVTRLSRNVNAWSRWFDENQDKFKSGQRYRAGELLSPRVLAETMMAETAPCVLRQYCGEELTIRYGYDFPFETDLRVKQQTLLLRQAADWSLSMRRHFQEGAWYFAGDCISSRPS